MSTESIPINLQTLLVRHYFLSQITRGHKPCMSNMTLVDSSSWKGAIYRFWKGETRKTGMADIEKIIGETIDIITIHKNKPEFLRLLINALADTRNGIESMLITYRSDPDMIGRVRVQLNNIDLQLRQYQYLLKGYNDHSNGSNDNNNNSNNDNNKTTELDDKILDAIVNSTDTSDREGLRNFLTGKSSVVPPTLGSVNQTPVTAQMPVQTDNQLISIIPPSEGTPSPIVSSQKEVPRSPEKETKTQEKIPEKTQERTQEKSSDSERRKTSSKSSKQKPKQTSALLEL